MHEHIIEPTNFLPCYRQKQTGQKNKNKNISVSLLFSVQPSERRGRRRNYVQNKIWSNNIFICSRERVTAYRGELWSFYDRVYKRSNGPKKSCNFAAFILGPLSSGCELLTPLPQLIYTFLLSISILCIAYSWLAIQAVVFFFFGKKSNSFKPEAITKAQTTKLPPKLPHKKTTLSSLPVRALVPYPGLYPDYRRNKI